VIKGTSLLDYARSDALGADVTFLTKISSAWRSLGDIEMADELATAVEALRATYPDDTAVDPAYARYARDMRRLMHGNGTGA
jgi:hypothetical protein